MKNESLHDLDICGGGWNFRLMKKGDVYGVHEVYYNSKGEPNGWTKDAVLEEDESIEDIKWQLEKMLLAFTKSVLDFRSEDIAREITLDKNGETDES